MKVKSESLVLQLRQHSSYLARAIVRLIVMLARAIFRSRGDFARARVNARLSGHGLYSTPHPQWSSKFQVLRQRSRKKYEKNMEIKKRKKMKE